MKKIKNIIEFFLHPSRRQRLKIVNYLFQRVLGVNKEFPLEIHFTSIVSSPERIKYKGGVKFYKSMAVSGQCYFSAYNGIEFGYNVLFAPGVKIISSNHDFTKERMPVKASPVVIGDNVWLGTSVVILPEVEIGKNSIIAAGAVVNKNVPDNAIVAGVPAKIVGWLCVCGSKLQKYEDNIFKCDVCGRKYMETDNGIKEVNAEK